jgi:hypothetical protein
MAYRIGTRSTVFQKTRKPQIRAQRYYFTVKAVDIMGKPTMLLTGILTLP